MEIKEFIYSAPQVKVIEINAQQVICGSTLTEGFGMSDNTYDEEDWE